jgi:hypothetical protein
MVWIFEVFFTIVKKSSTLQPPNGSLVDVYSLMYMVVVIMARMVAHETGEERE